MLSGIKLANKGIYEQYLSLTNNTWEGSFNVSEDYIEKAKAYLKKNKHLTSEKEVDQIISTYTTELKESILERV